MSLQRTLSQRGVLIAALSATCIALVVSVPSALGAARKPIWTITSMSTPTNFKPGGPEEEYVITATNTGDAPAEGASSPITLKDVLPAGFKVAPTPATPAEVAGVDRRTEEGLLCETATVSCRYEGTVLPGDSIVMNVGLEVAEGTSSPALNAATVEGGEAASATSNASTVIGSTPAIFGIEPSSLAMAPSTSQAGAHPDLMTTFAFNQSGPDHPANNIRDVTLDTPPGLVGDPTATPSARSTK